MQQTVREGVESRSTKTALITGASSGLGLALANFLSQKNYRLLVTARHPPPLSVEFVAADLSHRQERQKIVELIHRYSPDLVINNAGFGLYGAALDHPIEKELEMMEVNGSAVLEFTLEAAKALRTAGKGGTIVNISSAAAFFPYPYFATYAAMKRFVLDISQALDAELKKEGIRVLVACPGQFATSFQAKASQGNYQSSQDFLTLSQEKVVQAIWKQIETQKGVSIIDGKYRCMVFLSKFIPRPLLNTFLSRSLKKRIAVKKK
ncbi:MAG TPA: SDR family NAD(P)-dependent oxidoreductase [Candidatus Babeliaceae bacterium]|nr:SDR family NAD(P)-dependent oxidoreductase [Candidatus Babeliaceae bacterium]